MALGLPIISTKVGGMPFLIETNKTGVLVEPNSEEAFVKSIKELIDSADKTKEIALEYGARFYQNKTSQFES